MSSKGVGLGDDLRNLSSQVIGLEDAYDRMVVELADAEDALEKLQKYIDWAERYYPSMKDEYSAICAVKGE